MFENGGNCPRGWAALLRAELRVAGDVVHSGPEPRTSYEINGRATRSSRARPV